MASLRSAYDLAINIRDAQTKKNIWRRLLQQETLVVIVVEAGTGNQEGVVVSTAERFNQSGHDSSREKERSVEVVKKKAL